MAFNRMNSKRWRFDEAFCDFFLNEDEWTATWRGGSQFDPAALARRIKLCCRYECKTTDPCLWFFGHRVGHLFEAKRMKGVRGGQGEILTVKCMLFTSGNRRPASYVIWFVSSCALKCDCWLRFRGRILAHVEFAWDGARVGFHLGLWSHVCGPKRHTLVGRTNVSFLVRVGGKNWLVTKM